MTWGKDKVDMRLAARACGSIAPSYSPSPEMSFVHVFFFFAPPASTWPANRFTRRVSSEATIFAVAKARVSLPGPNTVMEKGAQGRTRNDRIVKRVR